SMSNLETSTSNFPLHPGKPIGQVHIPAPLGASLSLQIFQEVHNFWLEPSSSALSRKPFFTDIDGILDQPTSGSALEWKLIPSEHLLQNPQDNFMLESRIQQGVNDPCFWCI